jgi:hypothetical protein
MSIVEVDQETKDNCRLMTKHLINTKKIVKKPCAICGKLVAHCHHVDYLDPFNVVWLCRKHHRQAHLENDGSIAGIGHRLRNGSAKILCKETVYGCDYWKVEIDGKTSLVPVSQRKSWQRIVGTGLKCGRKKSTEPKKLMSLTLPLSVYEKIPGKKQKWILGVISEALSKRAD